MQLDGIEYPVGSGTFISVGPTTDYDGLLLLDNNFPVTGSVVHQAMRNSADLVQFFNLGPREMPLVFIRDPESAIVDAVTWGLNLRKWFDPGTGRAGPRYLRFLLDDGTTQVRLKCHVTSFMPRPGNYNAFDGIIEATVPYLQAMTASSPVITTSGSITNNGNARAQCQLQASGSGGISGQAWTITDNSGNGVVSYPFTVVTGNLSTTLLGTDGWVLIGGNPVAFNAFTDGANRCVTFYVDIAPSGTTTATILFATGVTNSLANTLDIGNLTNKSSNGATLYNWGSSVITTAPPSRMGIWSPATFSQATGGPTSFGYGITGEVAAGSVTFTLNNPASGQRNDANGMAMQAGAVGGTLSGVTRVTTNHTAGVTSFIRHRSYGQMGWSDAWTQTGNATVSTSVSVSGAEVIIGIEYSSATGTDAAALAVDIHAAQLTLASAPTATSAVVTYTKLNGTIVNTTTGQTITFTNFMFPNGTLTLNASAHLETRSIAKSVAGPTVGGYTFSDPVDILSLDPGANSITESLAGTITVTFRDTWV